MGHINDILNQFNPINLDELDHLKLMNRVDNKYILPVEKLEALLLDVKDKYRILEINNERIFSYHTKYFDTPDLRLYITHQNGKLNRFKIRCRTYMVNSISFLEIKKKTNKGKTLKSRIKVSNTENINSKGLEFIKSTLNEVPEQLGISSENLFQRITLASFESKERITLDINLAFKNKKAGLVEKPFFAIAEVKSERAVGRSPIKESLKKLKIYPRGFSKYCMGTALLNPELKQNSFKKNLLYLNKLENANIIS